MALTPEELKDITDGLGIAEGKSLLETITEAVNGTLNTYDKRQKKELEKALEGVKLPEGFTEQFAELVEKVGKGGGDGDGDGDGDDGKPDVSKLPAWAREMFERQETANKALQKQFDDEKTAREERDAKLAKKDAEAAERAMYDAAITAATSKEGGGLDPSRMPLLLPYLKDQGLVRPVEGKDGVYEMDTGELDPIHGDPVYKPLAEGMKKFAGTDIGKTFRAARPGSQAPGTPGGDDNQTVDSGDLRSLESFGEDMEALRKAAEDGTLDVGQGS